MGVVFENRLRDRHAPDAEGSRTIGPEKDIHTMAKPIVARVVSKEPVARAAPSENQASHARDRN